MKKKLFFSLFLIFFILFAVSFTALICPSCLIGESYISSLLAISTLGYTSSVISAALALIFFMLGSVQDTIEFNIVTHPKRQLFMNLRPVQTIVFGAMLLVLTFISFGGVHNILSDNALILLYLGGVLIIVFGVFSMVKK